MSTSTVPATSLAPTILLIGQEALLALLDSALGVQADPHSSLLGSRIHSSCYPLLALAPAASMRSALASHGHSRLPLLGLSNGRLATLVLRQWAGGCAEIGLQLQPLRPFRCILLWMVLHDIKDIATYLRRRMLLILQRMLLLLVVAAAASSVHLLLSPWHTVVLFKRR